MKIYICTTAARVGEVRRLRDALRLAGHLVIDWTGTLPPPGPDFARQKDEDPDGRIHRMCAEACAGVDLVVFLPPAGEDAGVELGTAATAGVPVWAVRRQGYRPGLMVKGSVRQWFDGTDEIIHTLTRWRGW